MKELNIPANHIGRRGVCSLYFNTYPPAALCACTCARTRGERGEWHEGGLALKTRRASWKARSGLREWPVESGGALAGEVVSSFEFDLAAAEREVFEAQVAFDNAETARAGNLGYQSMLHAAKALVKIEFPDVTDDPERIVHELRTRFYDTQKFFDPFAGGKFAQYLFAPHQKAKTPQTPESVRYLIEEAQLFIEASHSCYNRMATPVNA